MPSFFTVGMHENGFGPDVLQSSSDGNLIPPMQDNVYPRSTNYNSIGHHPPPIESW